MTIGHESHVNFYRYIAVGFTREIWSSPTDSILRLGSERKIYQEGRGRRGYKPSWRGRMDNALHKMPLDTNNTILLGFAGTITTSVLGFAGSWVRQHYQSRSDTLDRQFKADQVKAELEIRAAQIKVELLQATSKVKEQSDINAKEIRASIAENTALTQRVELKAEAAYGAANHTNEKIASLHQDLLGSQKQVNAATANGSEQIDRMEGTGEDTNTRVRGLEGDRDDMNDRVEMLEKDTNKEKK